MGKFKNWLNVDGNTEFIPCSKISLILDELSTHNQVGIKVAGVFPITYGLLISVS